MKMTSNGKTLNYKVVDLVEIYNFHIKFTSIQVQKKLENFKTDCTLPLWATAVAGAIVPLTLLSPFPHGARCIVLQKNFRTIYF
jgi:hypothetical protein